MPAALAVTIGSIMIAVAGALHPPAFDPADAMAALAALEQAPDLWLLVHFGIAAGLIIWTAGIIAVVPASSHGEDAPRPAPSLARIVIGAQLVALPLWLSALIMEAVGMPMIAVAGPGQAAAVTGAAAALWPPVLLAGYAGTALQWAGLWLLALMLAGSFRGRLRLTGHIGLIVLPLGLPTLTVLWFFQI